ncbi:MAG: o-succinylbenzoate synthase [Bacteroidetes bacterium RIFCSPHIGHO2_02_FULL_44_7]|nr:MAG: o-succinylbenzoate synthase [Bacteroidetes bacterium RIFCSPHIGHO2_02_FULL_44_7]
MKIRFEKKTFNFKRPGGTSRGVLTQKHAWLLSVWRSDAPWIVGIGECSIIPGLSPDFRSFEEYTKKLEDLCDDPTQDLNEWPSLKFGLETALRDLERGGKRLLFDNSFSTGERKIPINGLIWMGDVDFMQAQIDEKLQEGYTTLKLKIGAIDFEAELALLHSIRQRYNPREIQLRVDANGAFSLETALEKLAALAELDIHSIEQPIAAGQIPQMGELCRLSPLPIALDEELIGIYDRTSKIGLLDNIHPSYIILKPSLHGGIEGCQEWIQLAEERSIQWWFTSALESNIGLNAICQLAGEYENLIPQGLGTGSLYTDNIASDLRVSAGQIYLNRSTKAKF